MPYKPAPLESLPAELGMPPASIQQVNQRALDLA
jgi:hypothetical protein